MSNTLSQNPDIISWDRNDPSVWSFPNTANFDAENPAAEARAEHLQHEYVEALSRPDDSLDTPEIAPGPVNGYEAVPAAGDVHGYATNGGNVIDPAHAQDSLDQVRAVVDHVFAVDPDMRAMQQANVEQQINREHRAQALSRAAALTERVGDMQDRALLDWGADAAQRK